MKTKTGLTIIDNNGRIEVYTQQELNEQYKKNVWWSKVKEIFKLW